MKIYILTDNTAGGRFLAEHGLSYLLEIDGEKILFDTGGSDVFLKNAERLGFNLQNETEKVVLSHGHWDHGNGLLFIDGKKLIAHPAAFSKRYRKSNRSPVGLSLSKADVQKRFELVKSKTPIQITENLFFLGEIPRINNFESQGTTFEFENGEPDFVPDDTALSAITKNGLVIVTGCSHSGICNICEHAMKVTGINKISAVIGGFHLKKRDFQTQQTILYFQKNEVETLLPSHCTQLPALSAFYEVFKNKQVKTGMVLDF